MEIIKKIIDKIEQYENIALFTHVLPDGDSLSSSYGLALALKENYPKKNIKVVSDYKYLKNAFPFMKLKKSMFVNNIDKSYLTIIGDVSIKSRILKYDQFHKGKEKIIYDHHVNGSNAEPTIFWHEPNYAASSLQAAEIAFALKEKYSEETVLALLFGILTDTGFFRYSFNDPKPPLIYSKLVAMTEEKTMNDLFTAMSTKSVKDIEVQKYIFENLKFKKNVSYVYFDDKFVKKYGYTTIKAKLNTIANIDKKDIWAFFMHIDETNIPIKVSIRSANRDINAIAVNHLGGGHLRAAGAKAYNKNEMLKIVDELSKAKKI